MKNQFSIVQNRLPLLVENSYNYSGEWENPNRHLSPVCSDASPVPTPKNGENVDLTGVGLFPLPAFPGLCAAF